MLFLHGKRRPFLCEAGAFFHLYAVCKLLMQATVSEMRAYKKSVQTDKKGGTRGSGSAAEPL